MSYWYGNYESLYLDVYKDIDVKFDVEVDHDIDYNLDIYKDVDVDVDIKTDVDLEGHSAVATGAFEEIGPLTVIGTVSTATTPVSSHAQGTGAVVDFGYDTPHVYSDVTVDANAIGYATFAEIDIMVEEFDHGSLTTVISESATDNGYYGSA